MSVSSDVASYNTWGEQAFFLTQQQASPSFLIQTTIRQDLLGGASTDFDCFFRLLLKIALAPSATAAMHDVRSSLVRTTHDLVRASALLRATAEKVRRAEA